VNGIDALDGRKLVVPKTKILFLGLLLRDERDDPGPAIPITNRAAPNHASIVPAQLCHRQARRKTGVAYWLSGLAAATTENASRPTVHAS
jgi:hypothetical protein